MVLPWRSTHTGRKDMPVLYNSTIKNKILLIGVEKWTGES